MFFLKLPKAVQEADWQAIVHWMLAAPVERDSSGALVRRHEVGGRAFEATYGDVPFFYWWRKNEEYQFARIYGSDWSVLVRTTDIRSPKSIERRYDAIRFRGDAKSFYRDYVLMKLAI